MDTNHSVVLYLIGDISIIELNNYVLSVLQICQPALPLGCRRALKNEFEKMKSELCRL